eukprot:12087743-Alexandrium_andersonii.AAC.1
MAAGTQLACIAASKPESKYLRNVFGVPHSPSKKGDGTATLPQQPFTAKNARAPGNTTTNSAGASIAHSGNPTSELKC